MSFTDVVDQSNEQEFFVVLAEIGLCFNNSCCQSDISRQHADKDFSEQLFRKFKGWLLIELFFYFSLMLLFRCHLFLFLIRSFTN